MAKKKKFKKIINIPVTEIMYDQISDLADKEHRTLACMTRELIDRKLNNKLLSFKDGEMK